MKKKSIIAVVGNPNCGKTSLFNILTKSRRKVGNWPGVTVSREEGSYTYRGRFVLVVDLPGIYSLSASSLDEKIAREYILHQKPDLVVNIVDASNLERNLYLTIQLIEMRVPCVVILNKMDIAKSLGIRIKLEELSRNLNVPISCTVASKDQGIDDAKDLIEDALNKKLVSKSNIYFPKEIEQGIKEISLFLKNNPEDKKDFEGNSRWIATKLLEEKDFLKETRVKNPLFDILNDVQQRSKEILGEQADIIIADSRYGFINSLCKKVVIKNRVVRRDISDLIDKFALNRYLGIPIFLLAMYLTFWITISFGGCFVDFFDLSFGAIFVDGFRNILTLINAPEILKVFLADGLGGGIQTVATFVPTIFFMFFCLAILEDSGYMARAAFVMDGLMRAIGLPGKAFVSMLMGFGCNVPAIMSTRTLESVRDRTLAVVINPFISCGARLPVYAVFAAAFFPSNGGLVIFALYVIGILCAIMTAFLLKNTVLKGDPSAFIMELPPYHKPTLKGILVHTWERLKGFIFKAGKAILFVVVLLNLLYAFSGGSNLREQGSGSVLKQGGQFVLPVFKPMGIRQENWPAVIGIFTGVFAKESVVGTLDSLYRRTENREGLDENFNFGLRIKQAFLSVPENIEKLNLPFSSKEDRVNNNEISGSFRFSLIQNFDGKVGAFAYLLMVLLYMPCIATIAAINAELNLKWMIFSILYSSLLGWSVAVLFYQTARFYMHPIESLGWILFIGMMLFSCFIFIKDYFKKYL
ncbi:MAG: Fe(2+) transporter permease subunit FeoB [Candidatus Omnitrophica bacterium]|nr:Fe(2+) transporter permease subunit FeoB [Candidatus Omnitrophota bacterium]